MNLSLTSVSRVAETISGTWTLLRSPQILSALLSVRLQKLQLLLLLLLLLAAAMAGHTPRVPAAQLGLRRLVPSAQWWGHQSALFFFSFLLTCSCVRRCRVERSSAGITSSNGMHTFVSAPSLLTDAAQWAQLRAQRDEISFNWSHFFFFKLAIMSVNTGWHCCCSGALQIAAACWVFFLSFKEKLH